MTAFEGTNQNLAWDSALQADDLDVSFGTYMSAAASDFWGYNPSVALSRAHDVYASQVDMDTLDVDSDAMSFDPSAISRREGMGLDDQKAWIEKEGLTGHLVPQEGYNEDTLKLLAEAKHRERENAMIREAAPAWMAVPGFVAGLGMSFLDPINLAAGFFPVVGQARQMQMLSRASGVWGATARRAGIGLAEGTVGAMAVEPIIQLGRSAEQADWEMSQSVLNIAFGSIIGATMHVGKGAFGDLMRLKNRQRQPWESAPSTDSTEALRTSFVDDMYEAAQEAGANITREQAIAESIRFDSRARAWAYDTGRTPEEYYRTRRPDFRAAIARDAENFEKTVGAELEGIAAEDAAPVEGRADTGAEEGIMPAEAAGKQGDTAEAAIAEIREASAAETPAAEAQPPATRFYTAESGATRYRGDDVSILNGHEKENARYELRELSDVIPSHDPEAQFARRADYPENVQERPYHSDAGEQQKVLRNAATLEPGYLVNNNPDAVNGPPIITEEGIVLGGNSRTMSIQLAYASHPERAEAYRSSLKKWGQMFGIDPAAVDSFQRPVLVRVVEGGQDAQAMAVKSRLYNQSQTQGLQAKAEGVSKGKLVSRETLDALTQGMEDFDTLRGFMASPKSKEFIQALFNDGVIEQTQLHRLTDEHGLLNDAGKDLVENALRGHIVQDYDVLAAAPAGVLANLDRSLPALARLKARREGWDMSGVVTRALKLINRAQKEDRALEIMLSQGSMAGDTAKAGVQAMALTLKNATSKEVQLRFNALADAAERTHRGQSVMVLAQAANDTPAKAFIRTFMKPIASVDGEPVPGFNPAANKRHEAIRYAYDNGGKGHSVRVAEEALQKTVGSRKVPAEEKAKARELLGEFAQMDGAVAIYDPQLGPFFRYLQGDELWQMRMQRSIDEVRKQYEGTEQWMRAPNGQQTKLAEHQWLAVRTKEFKEWFGDWEADPANASKVVDENGEPMVMYHQSPNVFDTFRKGTRGGKSGNGIYFSARPLNRFGGERYEVFLNLRNPLTKENAPEGVLSKMGRIVTEVDTEAFDAHPEFDGAMVFPTEVTVREPNQIKSVHNRGTFDAENPNIYYQFLGERGAAALDAAQQVTTRIDNLGVAREMEAAGKDAKAVKLATGWERGADGKWHYETLDARLADIPEHGARLGDVLADADELFAAYPELRDVTIQHYKGDDSVLGAYDAENKVLRLNVGRALRDNWFPKDINEYPVFMQEIENLLKLKRVTASAISGTRAGNVLYWASRDRKGAEKLLRELRKKWGDYNNPSHRANMANDLTDTVVHEIQHAIQGIEGFEHGGNPAMFDEHVLDAARLREEAAEARKYGDDVLADELEMRADEIEENGVDGNVEFNGVTYEDTYAAYHSMVGEVEARNVQRRRDMIPEDRRGTLASETEDVARAGQILFGEEGGTAASMNPGVNLNATVELTSIERKYPAATLKEKRKAIAAGERERVVARFKKGITNSDTGWTVTMSRNDFDEHLKSDLGSSFIDDQYEATAALPELMERAKLVESHPDEHKNPDVKQMHRFYAPLRIGDDLYSVMLTVKEFQDGALGLDAISTQKLYHHRIQKKMLSAESGRQSIAAPASGTESIDGVTLRELLRGVKDNEGNVFDTAPDLSDVSEADRAFIEQGPKYSGDVAETARARVIFDATEDGRAVIEFFKSADASSAPHELYHIFRRELEETANMEGVSERAKRMWRDACEFVGAEPGQKWTVEMEEKFAKAGERFLMEGKAPIPALQGLFDKMKQWFTEIYQNADEAGLEISDGMRRMFGEMLTPSAEEADAMFRYSLGKILESDPSEGMDTRIDLPEDTGDARQVLAEAQADAQGRVERQLEDFAERLPEEDIAAFRDEYNEAMATEDEAIRQAEQRGELLREAAACDLGGM